MEKCKRRLLTERYFVVLGGNPSLLYPTTKGAIIQMTRAMAAQHGQENIRVNCVCPGMVYTPMTRGRGMTDEMRQARINQNLMKKEGTGWDVGHGMFKFLSIISSNFD
jgi:NAD(P)-dependent dehydrogenase (short-subunit alcohol dehydrogenase family)